MTPPVGFDAVVAQFGPALRRLTHTYEARSPRQEELLQEIWLALWQALPRFREQASLRTYVLRVAHNVAIKHVRRDARDPRHVDAPGQVVAEGPDPGEALDRHRRRATLVEAVRALPEPDRQVAMLHLEGLGNTEVAAVTGLSVSNVGTRLHRIRVRLRHQLEGPDVDGR